MGKLEQESCELKRNKDEFTEAEQKDQPKKNAFEDSRSHKVNTNRLLFFDDLKKNHSSKKKKNSQGSEVLKTHIWVHDTYILILYMYPFFLEHYLHMSILTAELLSLPLTDLTASVLPFKKKRF